jgi:hypothetical protein
LAELGLSSTSNRALPAFRPNDTVCLALASWDLLSLLEHDPALSLNLIKGLTVRLRAADEHHRQ